MQTSTELDGLLAEDRRILLFSQFTEMLGLIEAALIERGIDHQLLTRPPAEPRRTGTTFPEG